MIKNFNNFRRTQFWGFLGFCITCNAAWASGGADSLISKEGFQEGRVPVVNTGSMYLNPYAPSQINSSTLNGIVHSIGIDNNGKSLLGNDIVVGGVMRTFMLYRDMQTYYDDMTTSPRNISFSTYPLLSPSSPGGSYPMLELNLQSKLRQNFDFNIGYSMAPVFTGNVQDPNSRSMSTIQNLNFRGNLRNGLFKTTITAGSVLWVSMSRFTMGTAEYRDNYFDRLPWDWYRKSFDRFDEYYKLSSNIGNQQGGRSPLSGVLFETEYLPWQLSFRGLYGRTQYSLPGSTGTSFFPAYTSCAKVEKAIFEKALMGSIGLTYYAKRAQVDFTDTRADNNTIISADWAFKVFRKFHFSGEAGAGRINNPGTAAAGTDKWSPGAVVKFEFDKRQVLIPFSVEYYSIGQGLASVDGAVQNANSNMLSNGYLNQKIYDFSYIPGLSQEVGQIANNRQGINLRFEGGITKFLKFQVGYAASQEISNKTDSVTIQHRVNAYQRSRLRPWFQANGPYHRIRSMWFRTFETFTINPVAAGPSSGYLKGFQALELLLKSNLKLGKHNLVLLNFTSLNTVTKGFPVLNMTMTGNNIFVADLFEDFTAAFSLTKKLTLVGEAGIELLKGSTMIDLSPDKILKPGTFSAQDIIDGKNKYSDQERVVNQVGTTLALGVDYDISRNMNIHLRERYMTQSDSNFLRDKFSGYETTIEFKIFF